MGILESAEHRLGRRIHPTLYTPDEFQRRLAQRNRFLMRVLERPKIGLIGSDHHLGAERTVRPGQTPEPGTARPGTNDAVQPLPSFTPLSRAIRSHRWTATGLSRARAQPSHAAIDNPVGASPARERAAGALDLIVQAPRNEPITLYGDGTQSRSFCYVDDLIEGFLRLMQTPKGFTGPVNLGNPGEFTMIELAEAILDLTGSRSELVHRPLPTDDPRQRQPDIDLAIEQLGWEPRIPLWVGLKPTIAYFERLLNEGFGKGRAVA